MEEHTASGRCLLFHSANPGTGIDAGKQERIHGDWIPRLLGSPGLVAALGNHGVGIGALAEQLSPSVFHVNLYNGTRFVYRAPRRVLVKRVQGLDVVVLRAFLVSERPGGVESKQARECRAECVDHFKTHVGGILGRDSDWKRAPIEVGVLIIGD